jgi:hypothetical protein
MRFSLFFKGFSFIFFTLFLSSLCFASGDNIIFSTYFGGSGPDFGRDIAFDKKGNIFVIAEAESSDFPLKNPIQPNYGGGISDVIIAKFSLDGSLIFSTFIGGSGLDNPLGLAVDDEGNAYVSGLTTSYDFPLVNPIQYYQTSWDGFIFKIKSDGSKLCFSTYLGSSSIDLAYGIAVDSQSNIYVTGYTWSYHFPTVNPIQSELKGMNDVFVTKIDPTESKILFSTYLGGRNSYPASSQCEDWGHDIETDDQGNVYVVGATRTYDFPLKNPYQDSLSGSHDAFVAKINTIKSELVFSTFIGGNSREWPSNIEVHSDGTTYICGKTLSNDFPLNNPLFSSKKNGFILKLGSSGSTLEYSTFSDMVADIKIDKNGNAYLGDNLTVKIIKYDGSELLHCEVLNGSADIEGLALDSRYNVYLCGHVNWNGYIPIVNAFQSNNGGEYSSDAFIIKYSSPMKIEVEIDIKPYDEPNVINLKSNGNIPVAIFSTNEFNVDNIDPMTITLAESPIRIKKNGKPMSAFEDINGDGLLDMIAHIDCANLNLKTADKTAVLKGMTFDGIYIRGEDSVKVIK